ncbi:MAG: Uma2 family endonuclease [Crocosphaera sp.]
MTVTIAIPKIELTPGSTITIPNLSWDDFESLLDDLGEKRKTRLRYYQGSLEIMSPLALHERPHRIIAYIITTILENQRRNWEDFGSTTLKRAKVAGVEPDSCFCIDHASVVQGCTNLDLEQYPPPDLAIECDVTSQTTVNAYTALQVPEVWIYRHHQLTIYVLENNSYRAVENSLSFPNFPIKQLIPQLVQQAIEKGTRPMLKQLKQWIMDN